MGLPPASVIARSEATKQSILSFRGEMDCFASLAMTKWESRSLSRWPMLFFDGASGGAVAARDLFLLVELGLAPRQFFRAHLGDVVVVELPGGILAPAQRRLHRGAGAGSRLQQAQRQLCCQRLRADILRLAGEIAEREVREQEARHRRMLDDILGAAHHHGGNAACLEVARNLRRRLVA